MAAPSSYVAPPLCVLASSERMYIESACRSGRGLNEAHRAALGSRTEECSLRPAQHLDTLEIEQSREKH